VGAVPLAAGLLGPALVPGIETPEEMMPRLAQQVLPGVGYAIFAGAVVSAMLSTVDSTLLACSALVSHNLIGRARQDTPDRTRLRVARGGVVVFGLAAFVLAFTAEGIHDLVQTASAFASAGVFAIAVFGLAGRFGGPASAMSALIAGCATWLLGHYAGVVAHPFITSLAVSFAAYALVGTVERRFGQRAA
jgi:Na+/proline symporter